MGKTDGDALPGADDLYCITAEAATTTEEIDRASERGGAPRSTDTEREGESALAGMAGCEGGSSSSRSLERRLLKSSCEASDEEAACCGARECCGEEAKEEVGAGEDSSGAVACCDGGGACWEGGKGCGEGDGEARGGREGFDGVECCKESSCGEPDCALSNGLPCAALEQHQPPREWQREAAGGMREEEEALARVCCAHRRSMELGPLATNSAGGEGPLTKSKYIVEGMCCSAEEGLISATLARIVSPAPSPFHAHATIKQAH